MKKSIILALQLGFLAMFGAPSAFSQMYDAKYCEEKIREYNFKKNGSLKSKLHYVPVELKTLTLNSEEGLEDILQGIEKTANTPFDADDLNISATVYYGESVKLISGKIFGHPYCLKAYHPSSKNRDKELETFLLGSYDINAATFSAAEGFQVKIGFDALRREKDYQRETCGPNNFVAKIILLNSKGQVVSSQATRAIVPQWCEK